MHLKIPALSIGEVATLTGLSKEVLRKWEARYGFPVPSRNKLQRREYSTEQIPRLRLIKILLDRGMRTGSVVLMPMDLLYSYVDAKSASGSSSRFQFADELMCHLKSEDPNGIRFFLKDHLARLGLHRFVSRMMPPMNAFVKTALAGCRITVANERLYCETLRWLLSSRIGRLAPHAEGPRVLLTTAASQPYTLGLMMAQAILALAGADCISLGAELGAEEIAGACMQYRMDIVALCFSDTVPARKINLFLNAVRERLPASIPVWAGGVAVRQLTASPAGVDILPTMEDVARAVYAFNAQRHARVAVSAGAA